MNNNLIDNRQIRVFISSTFQDMQDGRDYLMKHTFPILRKLASERDVTLTELDLRWGITEEEAKTGKVVEICLREIENSIPFFIGIIGNRYGWVPEKKDLNGNVTERFTDVNSYLERHLSVTEMEMQFGVLQRKEDMHAYFYIKEGEEASKADNPEMLERLKKEVQASRYPSTTYATPEDLGIQVQQAFTDLLNQLFPEGHLSELEKERIGQRSFMNQLCLNYIRDDKNFQVLDEWMQDWERHQMVVTGASGLGKSALIANWLKEKLSDENRSYNIIYHFTGNGGSESHHEHIMNVLCAEINDVYGWEEEDNTNKSQEDKLNDLFLKVASEGKKSLLIVLDAVNQIIDTDNAKLLNWLPIPPRNIKILFSTLEDDRTMEVFRNRHYPEFVLQPLDVERRKQLATGYLWLYRKKLTEAQIERIVTDKQSENTLVLKTLLDELVNYGVFEKLDERINYYLLPDTIEDFYQALLQSYEEDYGKDFVKQILSLIAVSRNGLSEDEILAITGYKQLHWSQFYCAFASHLNAKNGLISFSHQYVQNAVWCRYLDKTDWEHFCRTAIIGEMSKNSTIRSYAELPYQYEAVSDYDSLYHQLLNLDIFCFLYKNYKNELATYWRKLFDHGYDCAIYKEKLKKANSPDKTYDTVIAFFRDYFSLFDFSLSLSEILLAIRKKTLGNNHPDTAYSYNYIGEVYYFQCNYNKALNYFIKAQKIREEGIEKESSAIAESYNNIGNVFYDQGNCKTALKYHKNALSVWEKVLGKEHPLTALSYNNIGYAYKGQSNYRKSLEYFKKALDIRVKVLGMEHPATAESYLAIGELYLNQCYYTKAQEFFMKALEIWQKVYGMEHPATATTYHFVGLLYHNQGNYTKALEYYKKALDIRVKVLGMNHLATATSYQNIGCVYNVLCDYSKALEYNMKALDIRGKLVGMEHPDIATSYESIGSIYASKGDYNHASEYIQKALAIREDHLGKKHPNTAMSYFNMAYCYYMKKDYGHSLEYHHKALIIRESILGKQHEDTARSYHDIALLYHDMGNHSQALEYYQKALKIWEIIHGKYHANTTTGYGNIGNLYYDMGDYEKAIEYYLLYLNSQLESSEKDDADIANSYKIIGVCYRNLKDYEQSLNYCQKALPIYIQAYGEQHVEVAASCNSIANALKTLGRYEEALKYYQRALAIRQAILPPDHKDIQKSMDYIKEVEELINKQNK